MIKVVDSSAAASLLDRGNCREIGWYREGFGSRLGGSNSSGKVTSVCLLIVFRFCFWDWCDVEGYQFFSA